MICSFYKPSIKLPILDFQNEKDLLEIMCLRLSHSITTVVWSTAYNIIILNMQLNRNVQGTRFTNCM